MGILLQMKLIVLPKHARKDSINSDTLPFMVITDYHAQAM
jgi:hypothetical protein